MSTTTTTSTSLIFIIVVVYIAHARDRSSVCVCWAYLESFTIVWWSNIDLKLFNLMVDAWIIHVRVKLMDFSIKSFLLLLLHAAARCFKNVASFFYIRIRNSARVASKVCQCQRDFFLIFILYTLYFCSCFYFRAQRYIVAETLLLFFDVKDDIKIDIISHKE